MEFVADDYCASADAETGSRASTEPQEGFGPTGFDPARGVSAFADVLIALLRERPEEWSLPPSFSPSLRHDPSKIELWPLGWDMRIWSPEKIRIPFIPRFRLWWAALPVRRLIRDREALARLKKMENSLNAMRDNVIQFRGSK